MFNVGDEVSYGMHGKCLVTAVETKTLGGKPTQFYALKALKNPLMGKVPPKNAPNILVPVEAAEHSGLRKLMTKEEIDEALKMLADKDTYFPFEGKWNERQKKLEDVIRREGFRGLVKVVGHLYVNREIDPAPSPEMTKFLEAVYRNLVREISDVWEVTHKETEAALTKALKGKSQA